MANDYFKAQGWFKNYATSSEDSRGVFQELVKEDEEAFKMAKAKVQRFEMDNFNTPDLDQGADSILRPGETLKNFDVTFRRPNAQGGRIGFKKGLDVGAKNPGALKLFNESNERLYTKYTKEVVDAASMRDYGVPFNELKGTDKRQNFRRKLIKEIEKSGKSLTEFEARSVSKQARDLKKADIKLKLIEATKDGNFFKPQDFADSNNLTLDQLKAEAKQLQRNIYNKRMITKGMETGSLKLPYIPTDINVTDQVLKTLADSKLVVNKSGQLGNIMFDAFGREKLPGTDKPNPDFNQPKLDAIKKNLNEYDILSKYLKTNYNIDMQLDHPLDKKTIKQLMNGTAEELSRVNVLERNLNNGFKKTLNDRYLKAVDSNNLVQKRAVEKIAKKFNLNLGSVPDGSFFDVSKINRGVDSFETLNIKDEMLKSLDNAAELNTTWGKYVKENPGIFKDAGFDLKTLKKPKNVENIANNIEDIRAYIKKIDPVLAKKVDITLNSGIPVDQMLKEIRKIPGVNKLGKGFMKVGGPFEVAFLGFDTVNELSKGKDFDESFKTAVQNLTFGAYKGGDREKLETLSDAATELNLDSTGFAELRKTMKLTEQIESAKKVKMGELASNDQSLTNMTDQEVEAYHDNKINRLQTEINNIGTSLKESGNFDTLVNNYTKVTKYVAGKQYDKGLEGNILTGNRRDRVFPSQGDIGSGVSSTISDFRSLLPQNFLQNSITKVIPNTLRKLPFGVGSIFEPTSERAKLFDSSKEEKEKRLNKMEPSIKGQIEQNYYSEGGITGLRSKYEYKK